MPRLADIEADPANDRILSARKAAELMGISRSRVYALVRAGCLPPPERPSVGRTGWWLSDILRHLEAAKTPEGIARMTQGRKRVRLAPPRPVPTGEPPKLTFLQQRFAHNHSAPKQPIPTHLAASELERAKARGFRRG